MDNESLDINKYKKLVRNAIQCVDCKDIVESKHRHDFVRCKCGNSYVDGGLSYQRCGWKNHPPIDLSEYEILSLAAGLEDVKKDRVNKLEEDF